MSGGVVGGTTIVTRTRPRNNNGRPSPFEESYNTSTARLFLLFACLWPLLAFLLFSSSPTSTTPSQAGGHHASPGVTLRNQMKSLLSRVDIMGYGPSHPRVAVVIVGSEGREEGVIKSVESVFRNTDRNRLLVICTVMDGVTENPTFVRRLNQIDAGSTQHMHWHGLKQHMHLPGHKSPPKNGEAGEEEIDSENHENEQHGQKVHIIFNPQKQGIVSSRTEAVDFVKVLARKHEEAGLKSPEEDLILLLLRNDATLVDRGWLNYVTSGLIIPPYKLDGMEVEVGRQLDGEEEEEDVTMPTRRAKKLANAISFDTTPSILGSSSTTTTSFDFTFRSKVDDAHAEDMAISNGESYPTPALAGGATALRLNTYMDLPSKDVELTTHWSADLELSLNLWLCGDGIDILPGVQVEINDDDTLPMEETTFLFDTDKDYKMISRLVSVWMDDTYAHVVYNAVSNVKSVNAVTVQDMKKMAHKAKEILSLPNLNVQKKCRPFGWYGDSVNMDVQLTEEDRKKKVSSTTSDGDGASGGEEGDNERRLPSKPLSQTNLDILSTTKPISILYEDVTDNHSAHPHKGAHDVNGNFGYIHDETSLRTNPPPFLVDKVQDCFPHKNPNYKMLTEKVYVDSIGHETAERKAEQEHGSGTFRRVKLFCVVYTIEKNHDRIVPIRETWGQKCDGFMVASTKTDPSLGTVDIVHEGPEEYNNIWQKVRSIWSYIYDNYYDTYDYFHIGGDDLYVLVENLRLYLESEEIRTASNGGTYVPNGDEMTQTPLFLGRRFAEQGNMDRIFNSGGSGYTLNKASLKALVVDAFPKCFPHMHTFSEDVMVATCLRKMGIRPYDTKDEEGGERYMPFQPGHHLTYIPPADKEKDWYAKYSINVKVGLDHCAARSVAFHYIKSDLMRKIHAQLYHHCT